MSICKHCCMGSAYSSFFCVLGIGLGHNADSQFYMRMYVENLEIFLFEKNIDHGVSVGLQLGIKFYMLHEYSAGEIITSFSSGGVIILVQIFVCNKTGKSSFLKSSEE